MSLWTGSQNSKVYKDKAFVSLILFLIFVLSTVPATLYIFLEELIVIYINLRNCNVIFLIFLINALVAGSSITFILMPSLELLICSITSAAYLIRSGWLKYCF